MPDYTITELNISNQGLSKLPDDIHKYTNLKTLYCGNNKITSLDNLPQGLLELNCSHNQLIHLDNIPLSIEKLWCGGNRFIYDFDVCITNLKTYILEKRNLDKK